MSPRYEHITSRSAYGEIVNNFYERLREAHREIWIGSDASGLISETFIRSSFFTDEQRRRWATAQNREAREDPTPSLDLSAAGCLPGHAPTLAKLDLDPRVLMSQLETRRRLTLHRIGELMGEALVPDALGGALYTLASELPGAEVLESATDELGRAGHGLARTEGNKRVELIFTSGGFELLGMREVLLDAADYAPSGTLVGWVSYMSREVVESLPAGTPPVPGPPCSQRGAGRGTSIEPGFVLGTGWFTDLAAQLDIWLADGVITQTQHDALKDRA